MQIGHVLTYFWVNLPYLGNSSKMVFLVKKEVIMVFHLVK